MKNFSYPNYLMPLDEFLSIEVIGDVREKKDKDGKRKSEMWTGENRLGWVIPVEVIKGSRKKKLPNGRLLEIMDTEIINVTLWSEERPDLSIGDYAAFSGLMVGAVDGKVYIQALKVEKIVTDFNLNLGDN